MRLNHLIINIAAKYSTSSVRRKMNTLFYLPKKKNEHIILFEFDTMSILFFTVTCHTYASVNIIG